MLVDEGCEAVDHDLVGAWLECDVLDVSNDLSSGGKEEHASGGEITDSKFLFVGSIGRHDFV